jgi:hypothetical protein
MKNMKRLKTEEEEEKDDDDADTELEHTTNHGYGNDDDDEQQTDESPLQEQSSHTSWFRSEYLANFGVQYNFNIMR